MHLHVRSVENENDPVFGVKITLLVRVFGCILQVSWCFLVEDNVYGDV